MHEAVVGKKMDFRLLHLLVKLDQLICRFIINELFAALHNLLVKTTAVVLDDLYPVVTIVFICTRKDHKVVLVKKYE